MICRFVSSIGGSTTFDLNDQVNYFYLDESDFPLPEVKHDWVENALNDGARLASWTLGGNTITLNLLIKGTDGPNAYSKLQDFLRQLLKEQYLEVCLWGATNSVYYKTAPALPKLPDITKKFVIDQYAVTNIRVEIPVFPRCWTSKVRLDLIKGLGINDSFELRNANDFTYWVEAVSGGTITANTTDFLTGAASCKLTTTNAAHTTSLTDEVFIPVDATHHHNAKLYVYKNSGSVVLDCDVLCYDEDETLLDTLALLTGYDPPATTWLDAIRIYGYPVISPVGGAAPAFPATTTQVKRQIRHDTDVGVISLDSLLFADSEYLVDHEYESACGIQVPVSIALGDLKSPVQIAITNAYSPATFSAMSVPGDPNYAVAALDATHVYAAGTGGTLDFFNGVTWAAMTPALPGLSFYALYALDNTHVYAGRGDGKVDFFDGATWVNLGGATGLSKVLGIYAQAANNVYACGHDASISAVIVHWNGAAWSKVHDGGSSGVFTAIHGTAANNIYACGHGFVDMSGNVWHWNGAAWSLILGAGTWTPTPMLYCIYALDATHIWAVGDAGAIRFYNGSYWSTQDSGVADIIPGVYAADSTHVWAVTSGGRILTFDGTNWTAVAAGGAGGALFGVSGISTSVVWACGGSAGTILRGVNTISALPLTNFTFAQRDDVYDTWSPVKDALGATQTTLYTRRRQKYRQMAAAATEKFRWPVGSHRGRYIISIGCSFGASTAYDKVTVKYYLEDAAGNKISAVDIAPTALDMGDPNTDFKEVASQTTRLANISIPTHFVPAGANENNVFQCVEVDADALLATTEWLDEITLIPVDHFIRLSSWSGNAMILDSDDKIVLLSQDGGLDTTAAFDPTKIEGACEFYADPDGMNFTMLATNIVSGDEQLTPKVNIALEYYPAYLLTAE